MRADRDRARGMRARHWMGAIGLIAGLGAGRGRLRGDGGQRPPFAGRADRSHHLSDRRKRRGRHPGLPARRRRHGGNRQHRDPHLDRHDAGSGHQVARQVSNRRQARQRRGANLLQRRHADAGDSRQMPEERSAAGARLDCRGAQGPGDVARRIRQGQATVCGDTAGLAAKYCIARAGGVWAGDISRGPSESSAYHRGVPRGGALGGARRGQGLSRPVCRAAPHDAGACRRCAHPRGAGGGGQGLRRLERR